MSHSSLRVPILTIALALSAHAQQPAEGLRLYQVLGTGEAGLVDATGAIVHQWAGTMPGLSAHLMPDGSLIRTGRSITFPATGATGAIQRVSYDGTLLWDYRMDGPDRVAHHEVEPMPNGNVLVIAWDIKTAADAIAAGRDPALLGGNDFYPDSIVELRQTGPTTAEIVWEWHLWDHLVQEEDENLPNYGEVDDQPELVDINYPREVLTDGDWNHFNGLDYDPVEDLIVVSARAQNEIYVIDHSTTTQEAATHSGGRRGRGGDILYRWGNPRAHDRGRLSDQKLFGQHDPRFIPPGYPGAGNITLFNNQWRSNQSQVIELAIPRDANGGIAGPRSGRFGPEAPVWTYTAPGFHSPLMSSAQRLPNGNTLICSAMQNTMLEVTDTGTVAWGQFISHAGIAVFQAHYVERSLWSSAPTLSVAAGGRIDFDHQVASSTTPRACLLLGSSTGTNVGWLEGSVRIPLNADYLFASMATDFNTGPFVNTLTAMSSSGAKRSALSVRPGEIPVDLVGIELNFAHLVFDELLVPLSTSNPVPLLLVP